MRLGFLATNLVNVFIAIVEVILGLRVLLRLFAANANNGFVNWVYEMSDTLLEPFRGIFPTRVFENGIVLDFTALFAMLVYAIVGMLVIWVIAALTPAEPTRRK